MLNEVEDISKEDFKSFLDSIPNEDYFYILDNLTKYDTKILTDLGYIQAQSAFSRDTFDKIKKIWDITDKDQYDFFNINHPDFESIMKDKVKNILNDYIKQNNIQLKPKNEPFTRIFNEIPLTKNIKAYIDEVVQDAKNNGEFEGLLNAGFFGTDLVDNILIEFEDKFPNALDLSQEVKDYIDSQL
jgi:hypothetical protein